MIRIVFGIAFLFSGARLCAQDSITLANNDYEERLKELPALWQQTAAEYRALCYQAFNMALLRIDAIPKKTLRKKKLAIITDLDETILDNSYLEARLIQDAETYSSRSWHEWTARSAATAVPGAVEFLQAAARKGISIFYISNRDTGEVMSTLINLQHLQLPNADTAHMLFVTNTQTKEPRRQIVMKDYTVVMLMGDNLNDFMDIFERKNINERFAATDAQKNEWGNKFIVLPNATYGEWESAIYDYDRKKSGQQKENDRRGKLKGY